MRTLSSQQFHSSMVEDAIGDLLIPHGHERSFRMATGTLSSRRYLVSFSIDSLGPYASDLLLAIVRDWNFPDGCVSRFLHAFPSAQFAHLGYEEAACGSPLIKLYLEYGLNPADEVARNPVPLHLAFKWDPGDSERVIISHYRWLPNLSQREVETTFASVLTSEAIRTETQAILAMAGKKMIGDPPRLLEVCDEGTNRQSFDANLYDAELTLHQIEPQLIAMADTLNISRTDLQSLLSVISSDALGHVSAGVHRDGKPFVTLYHGIEAREPAPVGPEVVRTYR